MSILVSLALATICFTYNGAEECHPVLLGKKIPTPQGTFQLYKRETLSPGYGGDVLQFYEDHNMVYAIHRLYFVPGQFREQRLRSSRITDRYITNGCINVDLDIYKKIMDCCSNQTVTIR